MPKKAFTNQELDIWNSLQQGCLADSRHYTTFINELSNLGLTPVMMLDATEELVPYKSTSVSTEPQYYYHPADLERVVGSTTSTWVNWAELILQVKGLVPIPTPENHPMIQEHVPRVRLPVDVKDMLYARGVTTGSTAKLVSLPMVVFFIAAQYGAWASQEEVDQVAPFKELVAKYGPVRTVEVRKGLPPDVADVVSAPVDGNVVQALLDNEDELSTLENPPQLVDTDSITEEVPTEVQAPQPKTFADCMQELDEQIQLLQEKRANLARGSKYLQAQIVNVTVSSERVVVTLKLPDGSTQNFLGL
jgi:hypothetical protein